MKRKSLISLLTILISSFSLQSVFAMSTGERRTDIWSSIPFIRGADLCEYQNSFGQTRSEYMQDMVGLATQLMRYGSYGYEALELLRGFDEMYDKNKALATRGKHIDATLESTLKSYLSQYYRDIAPLQEKVSFRHLLDLKKLIEELKLGKVPNDYKESMLRELDYIAYGSYSFAPNCQGNIHVTLHLIGKDGREKSYQATGRIQNVMGFIARDIFNDFQKTKFPSTVRLGSRTIQLIGSLSGGIGKTNLPKRAELACQTLGGKLPSRNELELLDMLGSYNGGVTIGKSVWAMSNDNVYHPQLMNPSPVRHYNNVNTRDFLYYCIK